jgi:hypothetical protein
VVVYIIRDYRAVGLRPSSGVLKNAKCQKLDLFSSKSERNGSNRVGSSHPGTETDPVSETSCSLECWTMDTVQAVSNNKQTNSVALVRKRTIPTERPLLVGEVIVNFCG